MNDDPELKAIGAVIRHVNHLRQFPLSVPEIVEWAQTVRGIEGFDVEALKWLLEEMKMARIEWDRGLGIQNLTGWLPKIEKTDSGYRIKKRMLW